MSAPLPLRTNPQDVCPDSLLCMDHDHEMKNSGDSLKQEVIKRVLVQQTELLKMTS